MKRAVRSLLLVLVSALLLFSCAQSKKGCQEIFSENYGKSELSAGRLYLLKAKEWEDAYLSSELFSSLYATPYYEDASIEMACLEDCAVYLSSSLDSFCEIGIFLCYSNTDTERIAKMCHRRISLVSSLKQADAEALKNARVEIKGHYVIYSLIASEAEE